MRALAFLAEIGDTQAFGGLVLLPVADRDKDQHNDRDQKNQCLQLGEDRRLRLCHSFDQLGVNGWDRLGNVVRILFGN